MPGQCVIRDNVTKKVKRIGYENNGLYILNTDSTLPNKITCLNSKKDPNTSNLFALVGTCILVQATTH